METLNTLLSGRILPIFLCILSVFLLIYMRGKPFVKLSSLLAGLSGHQDGGTSPKKAVMMALAGTLGVGNIVGVADALQKGGAGVLFWMWISCIAAMTLKYAEIVLAMMHRYCDRNSIRGGPMFYLPKHLSILFCLLCLLCAFSMGSAMQTSACCQTAAACCGIPPLPVALILAACLAFTIFTAGKGLFDLSVKLVPAMTLLYTILCLGVILTNLKGLPSVFIQIFKEAFGLENAVRGSFTGLLVALRFGVIRGLLSNEAGCGTAPIAHASSNLTSGAPQGALGVIEVGVDTLLLCSLTGLSLLCTPDALLQSSPINAVLFCFSKIFGRFAGWLLLIALLCFAFATLVCWSFYTESCLHALSPRKGFVFAGKLLFCLLAAIGPLLPQELLFQASDLSIALMTLLNGSALFRYRKEIRKETEAYLSLYKI